MTFSNNYLEQIRNKFGDNEKIVFCQFSIKHGAHLRILVMTTLLNYALNETIIFLNFPMTQKLL